MAQFAAVSDETNFISALINTRSNSLDYGVTPEMMDSFAPELEFVISYSKLHGKDVPPVDVMRSHFEEYKHTETEEVGYYADEVINAHNKRILVEKIHEASKFVKDDEIEKAMYAISSFVPPARNKPQDNALEDDDFLTKYEDKEDSLIVPWQTLQERTGGIRRGDLWYLAARLSQGKSWSLLSFARTALLEGHNVKFYSLEMSRYQVMVRMHVMLGAALGLHVDHTEMRDRTFNKEDYQLLVKRVKEEIPGKFFVHDSSMGRVTPQSIIHDQGQTDLVIIDYAGLMSTATGGRAIDDWRSMGLISNMLKESAVASNLRILAAAQINREGDTMGNSPPKVKNLAQSDALGQDADVVLTHKQMSKSAMVYGIEKNRHGAAGDRFYTRFLPNTGRFKEISKDTAEEIKDEEDCDY